MRLFTIGPVEMLEEIKKIGSKNVPYFRTTEFSTIMLESDRLLKKFMGTAESSRSVYLTSSGSGAMEAVIMNCFSTQDKLLIINGGTFGQRFADICMIHKIPYEEIILQPGEVLTTKNFVPFEKYSFTGLLVNIDETSTGQLYDINLIAEFCRRKNLYLVVDAISSFLCDPYIMDFYGIDVTIISSQKGLCVPPGISVVVLNQRIFEERVQYKDVQSLYFDFKSYIKNFERGQTPFTPAVGICMQMSKALNLIAEEGLEIHLNHIAAVANDFRQKIQNLPVKIPEYPLSNAITPVVFEKNIAYKVFKVLKEKYNIMLNPTGGILHDRILRVAHIGNTDIKDNKELIYYMEKAIRDVNNHD